MLNGGFVGEIFTALAFASALVAMISLFLAEREKGAEKKQWEKIGRTSFITHIVSIFGIIGTLFYLIYTHQYEYHYVWDHSSNELPVYYMVSCFWEGQEGSFLLWCFWNSVLGGIFLRTGGEWRNSVLAIVASVELILSSMILGIYVSDSWVWGIYLLMALLPALYFGYGLMNRSKDLTFEGNFHIASIAIPVLSLLLFFREQSGFFEVWSIREFFTTGDGLIFGLLILCLIGYLVYFLMYIAATAKADHARAGDVLAGLAVVSVGAVAVLFEVLNWKVGSTPFTTLRAVFPDNPVYLQNPDFVPTNGSGLNPLLQNYWMVIHPPTLFLGFASTLIPFAYVVAGLIRREYTAWIKPALPWTSFSVMILGVGIIMGGYWAYETLNFGGYWNWDPVENSSLVPWICGVAALHAMLIYQRSKGYLPLAMILIISTFLLVLYSTFLTRSGILGDTSVHTFTDLGLSGQLLVLVFVYVAAVVVLLTLRWREIPRRKEEVAVWSAEFFLFLGVLVFLFAGAEIILTTSLPVVNKILGTKVAPPPEIQLFYYKWNVWFAMGFGILSGIGQFLWWRNKKDTRLGDALFRPFLIAVVAGSLTLLATIWLGAHFAYDKTLKEIIDPAIIGRNFLQTGIAYLHYGIMTIADELLLFSALFGIAANGDILVSILRKNKKGLKVMGGTVVHIGFSLMLLGMLFSSGYDKAISVNTTPEDLASFPETERIDNLPLEKNKPRIVPAAGYRITYLGKRKAQAPIRNLTIIEEEEVGFKVKFRDASGDWFADDLYRPQFTVKEAITSPIQPTRDAEADKPLKGKIDMDLVYAHLNDNIATGYLQPEYINKRMLYGIKFESLPDFKKEFLLYPEAEVNEGMGGITTHPARKIFAGKDIYLYVSSMPSDEATQAKYQRYDYEMQRGTSQQVGKYTLYLDDVKLLSHDAGSDLFSMEVQVMMRVDDGERTFTATPVYRIDSENRPATVGAYIEEIEFYLSFVGVDPEKGVFRIQAYEQTESGQDWVVIKAISKPMINLLWLGTFILTFGFLISIYRRVQENRKKRVKGK